MKRFGYALDPLCIICCGLYATNRWGIKPHTHIAFFHNWFNDLLLIPCALPFVLLFQRSLRLRTHDDLPTSLEIFGHLIGWSILFEWIGPHIMRTVGDPWDVIAYTAGAMVAWIWWRGLGDRAGFDWLAPHYRWMERFLAGNKLQCCRLAFLETIEQPRRALLIGEGHGKFLIPLLQKFPNLECHVLEASGRMLEVSRGVLDRNKLGETNVHLIHADVRKWNFTNGGFDLIVTNFVLDCFPPHDLSAVTETIASIAAPNATWLVSDFCEPPVGPSKWRAQIILTMMYSFFQRATGIAAGRLVAPDSFLSGAGFTLQRRVYFDWGMLHSDLWEFRPRLSARSKFREQRHAAIHEKRHAMDVV